MLTVNKELAKQVLNAIERDAQGSSSKYTFDYFCKTHNLYSNNDKVLGRGDYFISCPFHQDNTPSLGLNEAKRKWNCLGCSMGGSYIDFVWNYSKVVEGRDISWYQQINEILSADKKIQAEVKATTIFRHEKKSLEESSQVEHRKFKIQEKRPTTYPELATFMQRKKYPFSKIKYALLLMQNGFDVETIYKYVTVNNSDVEIIVDEHNALGAQDRQQQQNSYDLSTLMEE